MPIIILLFLIGIPLLEISIFAEVGGQIGGLMTVLLTVGTAALGILIVRIQGLIIINKARENMERGEPLVEEVIHGMFLFFAGFLLLVPGFFTDTIGALLLIPPVRLFLGRAGFVKIILGNPRPRQHRDQQGNVIIEGQYHINKDDDNSKPPSKEES